MKVYPLTNRRMLTYFIPILFGLSGIAFSQQLEAMWLRSLVILMSVGIPLFAGGNLLARHHGGRLERVVLLLGIFMLMLGAAVTVLDYSHPFEKDIAMMGELLNTSRILGMSSLLLGLFVVLYAVVRTGEDVENMAERFWHLSEHMTEGFILTSLEGKILLVNNSFLEIFSATREDVVEKKIEDFTRQFNLTQVQEEYEKRKDGIATEYEIIRRIKGKDHHLLISGTPIYDSYGRLSATLAIIRDITDLKELSRQVEKFAEGLEIQVRERTQQLAESEKRFRNLLLSMNEGFLTLDEDHRIRFVNQRVCSLLNQDQDYMKGRDICDYLDPPGRVRLLNLLAQEPGEPDAASHVEINFTLPNEELIPCWVAVAHIESSDKQDIEYSLVVTSLDAQKKLQRELEKHAQELEQLNEELLMHDRAKDSFLSNVSHELRTPLATVQGYVEMLESGNLGELATSQSKALQVMERNLQRLGWLINEMIEFSRMEIRGVQIHSRLVEPGSLIEEAASSIGPETLAKNITVHQELPETLPYVWFDRKKMTQVLGILLNNAAKFTPEGGIITLSVSVSLVHTLQIVVSDNGIGIDPSQHEKVFQKFFQVDSSRTRRFEGTGIGLSIAKAIVEAHDGNIALDSVPGKGSTFTLSFPNRLFEAQSPAEVPEHFKGYKILLLGDSPTFFKAVGALCDTLGIQYSTALFGHETFRALENAQPEAIILNDSANDIAGANTLRQLRQHPLGDMLPVLLLSSENEESLQESGSVWEDLICLRRPYNCESLTNAIHSLLFEEHKTALIQPRETEKFQEEETLHALVIDPDAGLLEWLQMGLQHKDIPCYCAASPTKALAIAKREQPDVIFLDIDFPAEKAPERIQHFKQDPAVGKIPLYVMTGLPEESLPHEGVAGVLRKPFALQDILSIIEQHRMNKTTTT